MGAPKRTVLKALIKNLRITEQERRALVRLQDRHNQNKGLTVNRLGDFDGRKDWTFLKISV